MEPNKIVDMIMKDQLSDASDAVKDMIMNRAASILTLEKEKVGANLFSDLDTEPEETENETDNGTDWERRIFNRR